MVLLTIMLLMAIITYNNENGGQFDHSHATKLHFTQLNAKVQKTIHLYYPSHWVVDYIGKRWGLKYFENCQVKDCTISHNRGTYDKSDVVIFNLDFVYRPEFTLPSVKQKGQIWIFAEFEAPNNIMEYSLARFLKSNINLHKRNVNWTMGYRRDADFVIPMGRFKQLQYNNERTGNIFGNKTKTIVWFNSHCSTVSKREEFAKILQKHFKVDIYGLCGSKKCNTIHRHKESHGIHIPGTKDDCFKILDETYKFYLSFENSLCRDYISEKGLHHIMKHDIIPIMRSGVNHSLFNPLNSFIDVNKFDSINQLVNHIRYLDWNESAYMEYMDWKKYYYSEGMYNIYQEAFCEICKRAHEPDKYYRIYDDIYEWTYLSKLGGACQDL